MNESLFLNNFDLLATAPGGVVRLKVLILTLAVQGKLVPQDPNEEPISIALEKLKLNKANGAVKWREGQITTETESEQSLVSPSASWEYVRLGDVAEILDSLRKPVTKDDRKPGPIPYYGASGIVDYVDNYIFDEPLVLVGEDGAKWKPGYSTAFQIAGKTWVNNHAHVLRPCRSVLIDEFLVTSLVAMDLSPFITGMTVPKLNQARLQSIQLALPPLAEQSRIVDRVEELMKLCDALEQNGRLADEQHARLSTTLFGALVASESTQALAESWQRVEESFDLLLDRPEAIDALEQTILQLALRGLLVPQDPQEEPASELLKKIRAEKDKLVKEEPSNFIYIRVSDMKNGSIDDSNLRYLDAEMQSQIRQYIITKDDIYMTIVGATIGKCGLVPEKFDGMNLTENAARLTPHLVSKDFLFKVLSSDFCQNQFTGKTKQVGVQKMALNRFAGSLLPLPPLAEQHRIIARIESLHSLCSDLRQRLEDANEQQEKLARNLVERQSTVSAEATPMSSFDSTTVAWL